MQISRCGLAHSKVCRNGNGNYQRLKSDQTKSPQPSHTIADSHSRFVGSPGLLRLSSAHKCHRLQEGCTLTALLVEVSICGLKGTRPLVNARTKGKRRPPHRRPSAASPLLSRTEDRCSFNIDAKEQENRFRFNVLCQCLYIKFRQPPPPLLLPPPPPNKTNKKKEKKKEKKRGKNKIN